MSNYNKAILLLRIVKILILIMIFIYLITVFDQFINNQLEKALDIIYTSIKETMPTTLFKGDKEKILKYLNEYVRLLTGLILTGNMQEAFSLLREIYSYMYSFGIGRNRTKLAESQLNKLLKLLQFCMPYLELTSKFFYIYAKYKYYIPFTIKPNYIIIIILVLILVLIILKIYIIAREDIKPKHKT